MVAITIPEQFDYVRTQTANLTRNLNPEDMLAQSMPDASPVKWHLAHTSWFFENFILKEYLPSYKIYDERYSQLFNSYYVSAGKRYLRADRGLLTRPQLDEVISYRRYVDDHISELLRSSNELIDSLVTVGMHHEMQHQELLLTDVLHLFSHNPSYPTVFPKKVMPSKRVPLEFSNIDGGMCSVGSGEEVFSYDCERPLHQTYLNPYQLANRLVTNGEWIEFMRDKAYQEPLLWLSDGWACKEQHDWHAPLYWEQIDGAWFQFGLDGLQKVDLNAPVCHVSFYEADAFARWAGKRLPREFELEQSAKLLPIEGNFAESESFRPTSCDQNQEISQLYGDAWEWTQSAFLPHPNFKAEQGALGEYNGKFMANQFVLKGGSCATPKSQMRASYRNFFYPHHRWQFSGLRLAADI